MDLSSLSDHSSEALLRAVQHWNARHPGREDGSEHPFTVAISGEVGARGTPIAQEIGARLGWPVYDRELLELIAREMKVRVTLLESVDERHVNWLQECVEAFASVPAVRETAFVRHLLETLMSLGAHGQCVIVGRGAAQVLPPPATLRIRLVADLEDRIAAISQELGVPRREALLHIETTERQRNAFIKDHFQKDPTDPRGYDLLLNSSRLSVGDCAELSIEAMRRLQTHAEERRRVISPVAEAR